MKYRIRCDLGFFFILCFNIMPFLWTLIYLFEYELSDGKENVTFLLVYLTIKGIAIMTLDNVSLFFFLFFFYCFL